MKGHAPLDLGLALIVRVEVSAAHAGADLETRQRVAQDEVECVSLHVIRGQVLVEV